MYMLSGTRAKESHRRHIRRRRGRESRTFSCSVIQPEWTLFMLAWRARHKAASEHHNHNHIQVGQLVITRSSGQGVADRSFCPLLFRTRWWVRALIYERLQVYFWWWQISTPLATSELPKIGGRALRITLSGGVLRRRNNATKQNASTVLRRLIRQNSLCIFILRDWRNHFTLGAVRSCISKLFPSFNLWWPGRLFSCQRTSPKSSGMWGARGPNRPNTCSQSARIHSHTRSPDAWSNDFYGWGIYEFQNASVF